jgi:hypothetical protein
MKRALLLLSILIVIVLGWFGESRNFFCLDNGNCITTWKTYNNVCYIIPGKYYGLVKPSKNYIQSTNNNTLTIYMSSELPNTIVYKSNQPLKVVNSDKKEFYFYDYNLEVEKFDNIMYMPNAKKNNDIKENVRLIDLFIQENYAIDKNGKKL